ncbi:MAG: alpha/beta hydrolase [Pseudomonadota bacterium]
MKKFERHVFSNIKNKKLVGHLYPVNSRKIVIMVSGFCSDKSSEGRFEIYAHSLGVKNIGTFTFDYSGVGESDDETINFETNIADLSSAISYVRSLGYEHIGLLGNSLGGYFCFKAYTPQITTIVTTGAPTGPIQYNWSEYFTEEELLEFRESGQCSVKSDVPGPRKSIMVDRKMLMDFSEIDQEPVFSKVKCPVLMIHGDSDSEEVQLYNHAQKTLTYLNAESIISVIPGAAHGFWGFIDQVDAQLTDWFEKFLS